MVTKFYATHEVLSAHNVIQLFYEQGYVYEI